MGYFERIKDLLRNLTKWKRSKDGKGDLQPKDILAAVIAEMERRKKLGIEERAFVPNVYAIYINPFDYDEMAPFISGLKEQLIKKLVERVKKESFRILSSSLSIDLRPDTALLRNQVVVESSFLKEKQGEKEGAAPNTMQPSDTMKAHPGSPAHVSSAAAISPKLHKQAPLGFGPNATRIIEEPKTRIAEGHGVRLEMTDVDRSTSTIDLKDGEYIFGRGREAHVLLPESDDLISRAHFTLLVRNGRVSLKDLGSTNGTKVNGIEVDETELTRGDSISAGKTLLKVA